LAVIIKSVEKLYERAILTNLVTSAVCLAVAICVPVAFRQRLPPEIPLWYSRPWGEEQLASPNWLVMGPVLSAGVGLVSHLIAKKMIGEKLLAIVACYSGVVIQIVLVLGLVRIVLVVS
jgi:hypothetical protein